LQTLPEICGHTFYLPTLGEGSVVVDLGASTAAFSAGVIEKSGAFSHCVEATPKNFDAIEESERLNKYFYAMGGQTGPVTLHIPNDEFHWGSIDVPAGFEVAEKIEVPGLTLDGLFDELDLDKIDLLKIDIEGAEINLFDSATDATLAKCAQITVEFHDFMDPAQTPDVFRIRRRLEALGFATIVFTRRHHGDVLFVQPSKLGLSGLEILYIRTIVKFERGLRRMMARTFAAHETPASKEETAA